MIQRIFAVLVAAALMTPLVPVVASGPAEPPVNSPEWWVLHHGRLDNARSAQVEARLQAAAQTFAHGILDRSLGSELSDAPQITNVRMSNASFNSEQNEFQIDINPTDSHYAIGASNDYLTSGTGYYRTSDGGRTWFAADMPGFGIGCCDPGVAYAYDGTAYFINLDVDTTPWIIHPMRSTDNGVTWTRMTDIPANDRPNVVVDNGSTSPHRGRVFVTYSDIEMPNVTNQILLKYSDDHGLTWTGPVNVSHTPTANGAWVQASQPRVAEDGTVYVGFQYYSNGTAGTAENHVARSTDGGVTFQPSAIISNGPHLQAGVTDVPNGDGRGYFCIDTFGSFFRHRSFPILGTDPTNSQHVYAAWAGGELEGPYTCGEYHGYHSDVLFSQSSDGGAHWTAPLKVNDDPEGKDQYFPWLDVAPNGVIYVGWHDRRDDPQDFKHVYYVDRSTNGGVSFGHDARVGNYQSTPLSFIGDYAGLAAANNLVLPMWWDSRNKITGDPYTAVLRP